MQVGCLAAHQDVVRERDPPSRCFTLLEGFCCSYKETLDGKRQIMAVHVPGDLPDLQSLHLRVLDNSIATVTPCRVGFIQHAALRSLGRDRPRLVEACWRSTLIDAAIVREWMAQHRAARCLCPSVPPPVRVVHAPGGGRAGAGRNLRLADDPGRAW
ncbi:Crp/Fnr family transcriptional regulator [Methylobacterium sp. WSM2598]|uniref:Crp/Fnr family transcriptional regulator n=1 Tax=Methylobacterium sp. WSM2598 TaxID=398261 RepID=UPI002E81C935|nr:cyclic nucleotide-binding domain-containing protein [Methylobacterium sp. WSM2598]